VLGAADRIRVPFDLQFQVGIRLQAPCDGLDYRSGLGLQPVAVGIEQDAVRDVPARGADCLAEIRR
jgi:hypothetical protein